MPRASFPANTAAGVQIVRAPFPARTAAGSECSAIFPATAAAGVQDTQYSSRQDSCGVQDALGSLSRQNTKVLSTGSIVGLTPAQQLPRQLHFAVVGDM
ncbi:hypothetical protein WJX79_009900 [Trebouxia sp. C0005]